MWAQGELTTVLHQPDLYNPAFLLVASLTGIVGFAISFSVLWFLSSTTPTTFSLVVSAAWLGAPAVETPRAAAARAPRAAWLGAPAPRRRRRPPLAAPAACRAR
jgi:hypothetical protein